MADQLSWQVIGPLTRRFEVTDESGQPQFHRRGDTEMDRQARPENANARLILHRTAVLQVWANERTGERRIGDLDDFPVRAWAVRTNLGQSRHASLRDALAARRAKALESLAAATGTQLRTIAVEPQGAMITGTGTGGIRDVGIELDGTHGWPIVPASTLKGVAHAKALETETASTRERLFGSPRPARKESPVEPDGARRETEPRDPPGEPDEPRAAPGSVRFFDALPGPGEVSVTEHVLTPHARDYHTGRDAIHRGQRPPPAEYTNPAPIPFLAVEAGKFTVHLLGPHADVAAAARLLSAAVDDLGVGAKTATGYGYMTARQE